MYDCQLKVYKCHFLLVLEKREMPPPSDFYFSSSLVCHASVASSIKLVWLSLSKSCHKFFFSSSLPISPRIWISLSSSPFPFFHGYSGRTIKMKIFGLRHEWTANGGRRLKATEQVSKDARMCDASDMYVAITRPSVTRWKVAEEERGEKKADNAKIKVTFMVNSLVSDHVRLCSIPYIIPSYLICREHLAFIDMSLRCILRTDVVCGGWNSISYFCDSKSR